MKFIKKWNWKNETFMTVLNTVIHICIFIFTDSPKAAEREIEIVFPHILHGEAHREIDRNVDLLNSAGSGGGHSSDANKEYLKRYVCPTLLRGLSEMYETRPQSPIPWLADWLSENNPYNQ